METIMINDIEHVKILAKHLINVEPFFTFYMDEFDDRTGKQLKTETPIQYLYGNDEYIYAEYFQMDVDEFVYVDPIEFGKSVINKIKRMFNDAISIEKYGGEISLYSEVQHIYDHDYVAISTTIDTQPWNDSYKIMFSESVN